MSQAFSQACEGVGRLALGYPYRGDTEGGPVSDGNLPEKTGMLERVAQHAAMPDMTISIAEVSLSSPATGTPREMIPRIAHISV